jgi:transcriptional regulator with XRE-family HTH domain
MQKQLLRLQEAQAERIELAPEALVAQCKSGSVALNTTCLASGYTQETLAHEIGKAREVLSRACNGRGGLDPDVLVALCNASGSVFVLQYMAHQLGFVLKPNAKAERLAQLEAEIEELRRAA